MAIDRTGSTAIDQADAVTALDAAAAAVEDFSALLDATSSTHQNYRQDVTRLRELIEEVKGRVQRGDNLVP
jgi:multidrug resistance efflux pump